MGDGGEAKLLIPHPSALIPQCFNSFGAPGCFSGWDLSKASIFMHCSNTRMTVGMGAVSQLKKRAPKTCVATQMSARVGESPWQNFPVSFSFARCASTANRACITQCWHHLV